MADLFPPPQRANEPKTCSSTSVIWFDDLHVGRCFVSRDYEMTQHEIVAFARRFDPQMFHLDAEAARQTFFGGLAASGWHTASVTMRLMAESLPLAWGIIGAGTDHLHWPRPTRPGDCLRLKSVVETMRPLQSRPGIGLVTFRCTTLDQHHEAVQVVVPKLFVPLRGNDKFMPLSSR